MSERRSEKKDNNGYQEGSNVWSLSIHLNFCLKSLLQLQTTSSSLPLNGSLVLALRPLDEWPLKHSARQECVHHQTHLIKTAIFSFYHTPKVPRSHTDMLRVLIDPCRSTLCVCFRATKSVDTSLSLKFLPQSGC